MLLLQGPTVEMQAAGLGTELFAAVLKFVPQTELSRGPSRSTQCYHEPAQKNP